MKELIRRLLFEALNNLKFHKIEVELFSNFSSTNIDYEMGNSSSSSYSSKTKLIRVTPVIDLNSEKFENLFDFDNGGVDLTHIKFNSENTFILCQEGILAYVEENDEDCDGRRYSFYGEFIPHSKIDEWEKIKNFIKPILTQNDIDSAIRLIGKTKEYCKTGHLNDYSILNRLKKKGQIENYTNISNTSYFIIKANGKYGYFSLVKNLKPYLPLVFDKFELKGNQKILLMRKGDTIYHYDLKQYSKPIFVKKENVNDVVKIFKDKWQKQDPEESFETFMKERGYQIYI